MSLPKFSGQEITVHIFTTLGVEPWGRILTGLIEVAIFLLVLLPKTTIYGVILSLGTITGAILSHFAILGLVVKNTSGTVNDGGEIFITALIILALTLINLFIHRKSIPFINDTKNTLLK
jgi:hypothetical protein